MGRRSVEARSLQSPLFRQRRVEGKNKHPEVCDPCAGWGVIRAHGEEHTCTVCGGMGFVVED